MAVRSSTIWLAEMLCSACGHRQLMREPRSEEYGPQRCESLGCDGRIYIGSVDPRHFEAERKRSHETWALLGAEKKFGDSCPLVVDVHANALALIAELQDKAAKWDAHERLLAEHPYNPKQLANYNRSGVSGASYPEGALIGNSKPLEHQRVPTLAESGPGLRAQGGAYTEPGEPIIYCDNGWD